MYVSAHSSLAQHPGTHILLDGQNVYHNLHSMGLRENEINWQALLLSLAPYVSSKDIQASWHRPAAVSWQTVSLRALWEKRCRSYDETDQLRLMSRFDRGQLSAKTCRSLQRELDQTQNWIKNQQKRFKQIRRRYQALAEKYAEIKLCEQGYLKIDPLHKRIIKEKGVDTSVTVRMMKLAFNPKTDQIILLSGDGDYLPAVQAVQSQGIEVHVVATTEKSLSPQLQATANSWQILTEDQWYAFRLPRPQRSSAQSTKRISAAA